VKLFIAGIDAGDDLARVPGPVQQPAVEKSRSKYSKSIPGYPNIEINKVKLPLTVRF